MTTKQAHKHLAWHETMELHELTAFQTNYLMKFKMCLDDIKDPELRGLYTEAIQGLELNLKELLQYYPEAPVGMRSLSDADLTAFYAAQLLIFAKTSVRNYAIAITETATPSLRATLKKQLNNAIDLHAKAFNFMYSRGLYPSYNLKQLLTNDVKNANKALSL